MARRWDAKMGSCFCAGPYGEWRVDLPRDAFFGDYRMVGDVLWPFHVIVESNGRPTAEYRFESVQFNTAVDPELFR